MEMNAFADNASLIRATEWNNSSDDRNVHLRAGRQSEMRWDR